MNDLREWSKVGQTDHGTSLLTRDTEYTSLLMAPAILRRHHDDWLSITIYWQTGDQTFVVKPDSEMTFVDGDRIHVLVSTLTSSPRGCANGHARIEAIETASGRWSRNLD